jgi:predicted nucleic acid-binding protein
MADRAFLDTNVFVYSVDNADPDKQRRAQQVLRETSDIVVSTQVMNEFYVITTRKLAIPLVAEDSAAIIDEMTQYTCVPVDADLVLRAIRAGQRWQLSHWDALMVVAAQQAACEVLLSEDLADCATYDGLQIQNPFRDATT